MPATFYKKMGFSIVDSVGSMHLLWKPFGDCPQPHLWKGNFRPTVGKDVVHIDLIHSSQCWGMVLQAQMWKKLTAEFPSRVIVQEHLVDDRKIMSLDCMTGSIGVYLDGVCGPSHPIDENEMRRLIQEALAKKTADNKDIQPMS